MPRRLDVKSPDELAAFNLISRPIWVFDVGRHCMWWGNDAAVALWQCDTLEELRAKDFSTDSETARQRLQLKIAELKERDAVEEQWTIYPGGVPTPLNVSFSSVRIGDDARQALLIEATAFLFDRLPAEDFRLIEAARYAPVLISYFDTDGNPIFRNPMAALAYGQPEVNDESDASAARVLSFPEQFVDHDIGNDMLACCAHQQVCREHHEMRTKNGRRMHSIDARTVRDPVTGKSIVLVLEEDITTREQALAELQVSRTQLAEAIEAMQDGFAYYDKDDRLAVFNQKFVDMHPLPAEDIIPGKRFEELLRLSVATGKILDARDDPEEWKRKRVEAHKNPSGPTVQVHQDGTIVEIIEYKTADGGIVGIRRDVTEIRETQRALAESEALLIDAVESLGDAFILTDAEDRIVLTNARYREYYAEIADLIEPGNTFADMVRVSARRGLYPAAEGRVEEWIEERLEMRKQTNVAFEQPLNDGRWLRVLESRTSSGGIAGIRVDITEIKEAQKTAEDASKAKSEFLSSMSHELRTPLNSILGFAQVLEYDLHGTATPKQQRAIDMINSSGQHLLTLITDVLDLSRIEAGRMELTMSSVSIAEILDDCLGVVEAMAGPSEIAIIPAYERDGALRVHADPVRLKQVLLNILSNAVKYNERHGKIWLTTSHVEDSRLRISVRDSGSGIAPDKAASVFSPFDRLGREASDIEGSGVGLVISKNLIELMDGDIGFESKPGSGTTFWIEIPVIDGSEQF